MGFIGRFKERRAERQAERARADALAAEQRAAAAAEAAERQRVADEEARVARQLEIFGPELAAMVVETAADAKHAIKLARIRKREIQAQKKELAVELADVREAWRERQAGRVRLGGGRGTGAKLVRGAVQAKRQGERMQYTDTVNEFSDRRQDLDQALIVLDRVIADMERRALG